CYQAEDGIRGGHVTGVQTCALPISVRNVNWLKPASCSNGRITDLISLLTLPLSIGAQYTKKLTERLYSSEDSSGFKCCYGTCQDMRLHILMTRRGLGYGSKLLLFAHSMAFVSLLCS